MEILDLTNSIMMADQRIQSSYTTEAERKSSIKRKHTLLETLQQKVNWELMQTSSMMKGDYQPIVDEDDSGL